MFHSNGYCQGVPGSADATPVLASFSRAAAPQDWPLAFAATPILEEGCAPPPSGRAALGLRSPPLVATVERHLLALSRDAGQSALASWPARGLTAEQAFGAVLAYLAAQVEADLSPWLCSHAAQPNAPLGFAVSHKKHACIICLSTLKEILA